MRDVSRICADLVQIHSENPPGRTDEVIEYIRSFLTGIGISSLVSGNAQGMCNLVTRGPVKKLLLCGHVDVVPALDNGWAEDPFSGIIDDRFVYGRGSTDMKGGCAAILSACETLANNGGEIPATLAFVCDEETGGEHGIRRLLADNTISPCDCIIAEPTPARHPNIGQKGLIRLDMQFAGKPAHGSLYPAVGVSAIMEVMDFLEYVRHLHTREYPVDEHLKEIISQSSVVLAQEFHIHDVSDILKRLTFNPGIISGGEKSNVVAQHCDLELEFRIPWGCRIPDLIVDISAHAGNGRIVAQESHDPSITSPECPLVSRTCEAIEDIHGGSVFPIVQWAASDARHLRKYGFNVIEYGPGELTLLHAIDERVQIESLEKASLVYQDIMAKYAEKG
ncbi:MAG: M20/M25/M40 family metallo-hydrolase [Methanoregula sp.]|nr:M20/M25/M40 family metallo-hydrolase [Methanoregula sp.]